MLMRLLSCFVTHAQAFDSEGRRYNQLVKSGNDDMRQDAVMQQFFQRLNVLLAADPDTRKRQLQLVTYKVRPFLRAHPIAGAGLTVRNQHKELRRQQRRWPQPLPEAHAWLQLAPRRVFSVTVRIWCASQ